MRALSDVTAEVTKKNFQRKYIALGRIVNHWPEIIGERLASKTCPVKIHYRGKKDGKAPQSVTLDIAASSADSTTLHYQKDLILERMNAIFGERWITSIRFVQQAANTISPVKIKKTQKVLDLASQQDLKQQLQDISDDELLAKLEQLGKAIFIEEQNR